MPIGSIIAPMFVGTVADRFFPSEQILGVLHLTGAAFLFWMARVKQPRAFFWVALVYALLYSSTLPIANNVVFRHVPASERDFPMIRVLETTDFHGAILPSISPTTA